ncbi:MAG: hypothetical protein J6T10_03865 [Methanobrevibacter sp.]|nr:hypothetical protein [Methanobrevibacter sp.]
MAGTTHCDPCDATGLAEKSVRFQDILNPLYAQGRVLETWGQYEEFLRYETIFFDVVPQKDPTTGEVYVTYKFKDGLAASSELTLLDDQCKVGWYEPRICGDETVLTENAASGTNVLTVESLTPLGGVKAGSTVLVMKKDGNPVNGLYIASIDTANNQITLANNLTTDLKAGDRVRRGAYLRDRNCETTIDNPVELGGLDYYSAFFRTISISHEFNWCDLNKDYLISGGIQAIVDAMFRKGDIEAIKEFLHAAFYDRNIQVSTYKWETMGLFPALAKAQENGLKIAFDLSECCDETASECTNARHQIQAFLDIVMNKAMVSGMYKNNVTVAMNKKAMEGLHMMQGYFQDYGNVGFLDGSQFDIDVGLPRIRYAGVTITFKYLPILNDFGYSVMLTIPEDKVGVYQPKYTVVDTNGKVVANAKINGYISNGTPMLRYIPDNPYNI